MLWNSLGFLGILRNLSWVLSSIHWVAVPYSSSHKAWPHNLEMRRRATAVGMRPQACEPCRRRKSKVTSFVTFRQAISIDLVVVRVMRTSSRRPLQIMPCQRIALWRKGGNKREASQTRREGSETTSKEAQRDKRSDNLRPCRELDRTGEHT